MKVKMLIVACMMLALAAKAQNTPKNEREYSLESCINRFEEANAEQNKAGWAYWFIPKGFADTLTMKMSSVFLLPGTHTPHCHNPDEAFYIAQGPALVTLNGEQRVVETGAVFYTPSGSTHCIARAGEGPIKYLVMKRETTSELEKPFGVGKKNYTIDDCITVVDDSKWKRGTASDSYLCLDKTFADGLSIELVRIPADVSPATLSVRQSVPEALYVIGGSAEVTLDGKSTVVGPNTSFYCPPGSVRAIRRAGNEPLTFLAVRTH